MKPWRDATRRLGGRVVVASACEAVANGAVTLPAAEPLPDDVETLKAMFLAQREALVSAQARATAAETNARDQALLIEKLEYQIARLREAGSGACRAAAPPPSPPRPAASSPRRCAPSPTTPNADAAQGLKEP
jgi:hypothetical protein